MLAATIVASMQVVGVTLIAAAIVIPAIVARLLTDSFSTMLWLSTLVGALCGLVGIYLSYFLDVASGATIVLVASVVFVAVYGGVSVRQRLSGRAARRQSLRAAPGASPASLTGFQVSRSLLRAWNVEPGTRNYRSIPARSSAARAATA